MRIVKVGNISVGGRNPIALFAGPCVIESYEHLLRVGRSVKEITNRIGIPYVLKASFDKANRTSIDAYRGTGLEKGLQILQQVKKELEVPILCDVHEPDQAVKVAMVADVIQIPAFLCRQTDLVCAIAKAEKTVNVKKGQFLSPWDMREVIRKIENCGNHHIILTERGVSFGYNNLVVDMRALVIMRNLGYPVMFDATHSIQLPGEQGDCSGGDREFAPYLARAAAAVGIDALFVEVHDEPESALCDGPSMLRVDQLERLLIEVKAIDGVVRGERENECSE